MNGKPCETGGAYLLHLRWDHDLLLKVGALGEIRLPAGRYIYVGSARQGIAARVARHRLLVKRKTGKCHWHVDFLLVHPGVSMAGFTALPGQEECVWSRRISRRRGMKTPVPGFGSSDCREGCRAHLYRTA